MLDPPSGWEPCHCPPRAGELGGALSGRDIEAVNKTISGLVKLLYPDTKAEVPDEALEQIVKLALEVRRRVKEAAEARLQNGIPEQPPELFYGRGWG